MHKIQKGFTIVELLIVIVVIGILAAITVAAYSGIQKQARNKRMVVAAAQTYKAISAYVVDKGVYPTTGVSCVGTGYPADATGLCWSGQSSLVANTELSPYMSTLPQPPMEKLSNSARGLLINAGGQVLEYTIIGESSCPSIGAPQGSTSSTPEGNLWCRAVLPSL